MNPILAYKKAQSQAGGPTRIDLLLSLYDGACDRLTRARAALSAGDLVTVVGQVARVQLIVMELAAGVRTEVDPNSTTSILRLYEFVTHRLGESTAESLKAAYQVLDTLRDGFRGIRDEAVELEQSGQIPPVPDAVVLAASA